MERVKIVYNDRVARQFITASVVWGIVGMAVGALIALQLAFWPANLPPLLTFGRLRPLHTNAVIFAFVGNMIFAGVYYSSQRLLKVRLPSDRLAAIHFWGWQLIIVAAALTLPFGFTQGKEYAELEWPIDLAIAAVWIVFAINFFWMVKRRSEKHLYVALWFYIATIVTITVLHVINSLAIPVALFKSYSVFGGVQDALVQWWYGHNAVAFFLTTPVLGIMYYFVPKAAERPVYSYRLSIIHFWALVFIYIWAGPHHLLNTALPDWAQSLGMLFSLMLWAPSWGGMVNGLLTLRGAWDRLRQDPVLKFFAAALTFYGMATFEGPLLSIKAVSGLAHYTDWIIGHVHGGGLGWNGFMAAGMFYWMVPRLYGTRLHSRAAANLHFYLGTVGILLYVVSMWVSGITQGLMWRAENPGGGLTYPSFVETLIALKAMYWTRLLGGLMYVAGFILMAWNLVRTARSGKPTDGETEVVVEPPAPPADRLGWRRLIGGQPVLVSAAVIGLLVAAGFVNPLASLAVLFLALFLALGGLAAGLALRDRSKPAWHRLLEGRGLPFSVLVVAAVLVGGIAEIVPAVVAGPRALRSEHQPYSALELEGARRLPAGGLLHLPLADDPPVHVGGGALRRGVDPAGVDLRSSVPVGLAPHRARPGPPGRQVPPPLALPAHDRSAGGDRRLQHAALSAPGRGQDRHDRHRGQDARAAHRRCALLDRRDPRGRRRRPARRAGDRGRSQGDRRRRPGPGQQAGGAHRLPAAPRAAGVTDGRRRHSAGGRGACGRSGRRGGAVMLGAMARDFFAASPLMVFPVAAMFLFLAAFAVATWRALRLRRAELDPIARLPLADDQEGSP